MDSAQFVLKTTPPRAHRSALPRPRLAALWQDLRDLPVIAVCAPGGFGKTSALVQWRRLWLERGTLVAWVTLDERDDPVRFVGALLHSLRAASGRAMFDALATQLASRTDAEIDALTGFLAEVANLATPTVLIFDDAERLPEVTARDLMGYLLHNAPANLQVVIGSRTPLATATWDLAAQGNYLAIGSTELRFDLDESTAILQKRFGPRITLGACARLHELTEGWPIGLQLAATAIARESDLVAAVNAVSARSGDLERYFMEALFSQMPPPAARFLCEIAILDDLDAGLCAQVTANPDAQTILDQLVLETPLFLVSESRDWIRLHPLARDFLLGQHELLPQADRNQLQQRAAAWLFDHGRFHEAGRHALTAGDPALAQSCALRALWNLAKSGRLGEARVWIDLLPAEILARDNRGRLVAAWVLAMSGRPAEGQAMAEELLDAPDPALRHRAMLVATCGAGFADRVGLIEGMVTRAPPAPQNPDEPVYAMAYANTLALVALHRGETDRVRALLQPLLANGDDRSMPMGVGLANFLLGAAYLADGQAYKAEALLRPLLQNAERQTGRRSIISCLYASLLAGALYERNQPAAAQALLAYRLDVIDDIHIPDGLRIAYRTLALCALADGDERRALEVLGQLHVLGESKQLPRFVATALGEEIRIHANAGRPETAAQRLAALQDLAPAFATPAFQPFVPRHALMVATGRIYVALATYDMDGAEEALVDALNHATRINAGREQLELKTLRAVIARGRKSALAQSMLSEVLGLAALGGIERLAIDTHPQAVAMAAELRFSIEESVSTALAPAARHAPLTTAPRLLPASGGLLTPKEAEVLGLLDAGLSNKLIAKTMDISDETVKWHLKNLFSKLNAGTRKHAVDRARMMGLVAN